MQTFLVLFVIATIAVRGGAIIPPTVCDELWPERKSVIGGDSLCYATLDAAEPSDTTNFLTQTCTDETGHSYKCAPCDNLHTHPCEVGGQRRGYELPAGWEVAKASPTTSLEAIVGLVYNHTFSTTTLQLRGGEIYTYGIALTDGGSEASVGMFTAGNTELLWIQDSVAEGHFGGWNPVGSSARGVDPSTKSRLLISTCQVGTYMPMYTAPPTPTPGEVAPPSACIPCNATSGCHLVQPATQCHTTKDGTWWDGAGSTGCAVFSDMYRDPCYMMRGTPTSTLLQAVYSSIDYHCYRVLEDGIRPSSVIVSQQQLAVNIIPAGFEIVEITPSMSADPSNTTRLAAVKRLVWMYPFGTRTLVMKGALVYTRFATPGITSAGTYEPASDICTSPTGGPPLCPDLVNHIAAEDGWCPSYWCKSEIKGLFARILIKTCAVGFYSQGYAMKHEESDNSACRPCENGETTFNNQPWSGIGATGCTTSTATPTTAPTTAPTTTSPSPVLPFSPASPSPSGSPFLLSQSIILALLVGLFLCAVALVLVGGTIFVSAWLRAKKQPRAGRTSGLKRSSTGSVQVWREMTPRHSALSEISQALLLPAASDLNSESSIDTLASDDERAKRIIDQGLWIEPDSIVVGRRLASGGMGELRLGRMTVPAAGSDGERGKRSKVTVVLKSSFLEMLGGDADEFWHEASMLSQIKHPQVVQLFGVTQIEVRGMLNAETQKRLFLVMEYCANGSLTDAVRKPGGYDRKRDFLRHAKQITSTLAWLHSQGIVHRDIKPSNVLLDDKGSAKLCDLGLSRFQPGIGPAATPSVGFTSATMTVGAGSAPYMPPEGLAADSRAQRQYDGRAWDVYSMAMLLTQMWTRKQLYEGLGVFQIVVRVSQGMRPILSADPREVPPRLIEIVTSMWNADRRVRPSADDVLTMLRDPVLASQIEACGR